MNRIVAQTIFGPATVAQPAWDRYLTSGAVHVVGIALLLSITFPTIHQITKPEHVTLVAPKLPEYKPKPIQHPPIVHPPVLPVTRVFTPPKPVVRPPEPKPPVLAKAPEIKAPVPAPSRNIPEAKIEAPPPPKPEVKTGVFGGEQAAKGAVQPHELKVGGFGDPNGVPAANAQPSQVQMARVGSFDLPNGAGAGGGGGHAPSGGIRTAGFGDTTGPPGKPGAHGKVSTGGFGSGDANGVPGGTGTHGTVRTGGFGESAAPAPAQHAQVKPVEPVATQVEILFKPKPSYTDEARSLHLEGQVSLEVTFMANGSIKVLRVIHGLGHGLDEAAELAATQVRFKPATRGGVPVDTNATINITFQLT